MRQHGFTLGSYTVTAARRVLDIAEAETRKPLKTRNLIALVTLDVRNAFTSAPWSGVVREMEHRKLPRYLVDISRSYLCDRLFLTDGQGKIEVTARVPQGSVLRPLLWNIHYDRVLKVPLPRCVDTVAYADAQALVVTARKDDALERKTNAALETINS
jgi:hypothetical protein